MSLLAFIIGFAGSNSCAYIKNMPCWKMEGLFPLFFSFLSPYICCLSFWRKLELCLIILLYYRGKNNSVPGNAAMPNSIPFWWFSQSLRFDQILLIARDQSKLNLKITWKSLSGFSRRKWVSIYYLNHLVQHWDTFLLWCILDLQGRCKDGYLHILAALTAVSLYSSIQHSLRMII